MIEDDPNGGGRGGGETTGLHIVTRLTAAFFAAANEFQPLCFAFTPREVKEAPHLGRRGSLQETITILPFM